jgi:hypothetical protein
MDEKLFGASHDKRAAHFLRTRLRVLKYREFCVDNEFSRGYVPGRMRVGQGPYADIDSKLGLTVLAPYYQG